jgi:hypothetical protein
MLPATFTERPHKVGGEYFAFKAACPATSRSSGGLRPRAL